MFNSKQQHSPIHDFQGKWMKVTHEFRYFYFGDHTVVWISTYQSFLLHGTSSSSPSPEGISNPSPSYTVTLGIKVVPCLMAFIWWFPPSKAIWLCSWITSWHELVILTYDSKTIIFDPGRSWGRILENMLNKTGYFSSYRYIQMHFMYFTPLCLGH